MVFGPLYARLITDRFVPWFSVVLGELIALTGIVVGTYTGTFTLAGPVIQAFLFDLGFQSAQVANRAAIYAIAPRARNRVNTAFMVFTFCGQLMGTAVGSSVYVRSGWVASGSVSVGFVCVSLLFCAVRGPWEKGWLGWSGGWGIRQKPRGEVSGQGQGAAQRDEEKALGEVAGEDESRKDGMKVRGEDEIVRDLESDAEKQSRRSEKSIPEDGDDGPKTEKI